MRLSCTASKSMIFDRELEGKRDGASTIVSDPIQHLTGRSNLSFFRNLLKAVRSSSAPGLWTSLCGKRVADRGAIYQSFAITPKANIYPESIQEHRRAICSANCCFRGISTCFNFNVGTFQIFDGLQRVSQALDKIQNKFSSGHLLDTRWSEAVQKTYLQDVLEWR